MSTDDANASAEVAPSQSPWSPTEEAEDVFWQLIRGRRTVRRYDRRPVPEQLVMKLLEAAHWAPSAHNRQPWRFVLAQSAHARQTLATRMAERWRADLLADGADPDTVQRRSAISVQRIVSAPLIIVPCLDLASLDSYLDSRRQQAERQMGVQSVALACQNLLLAAHHYGLGACWMCAPLFAQDIVRDVLDLPAPWEPQALLTIGYPYSRQGAQGSARQGLRADLSSRIAHR